MNETLKSILNRRSTRIFRPEQLAEAEVEAIVQAGLYAPSAMNRQPWHITVVQDPQLLSALNRDAKTAMAASGNEYLMKYSSNEAFHIFYHAPTVMVVSGEADSPYAPTDCAALTQNLLVAAESLGIGSCWVGMARFALEGEQGAHYRTALGIPAGHDPYYTVALGYKKNAAAAAPPRKAQTVNYIR